MASKYALKSTDESINKENRKSVKNPCFKIPAFLPLNSIGVAE
jgi:hypothetical protein